MAQVFDPIILDIALWDLDPNKFVRAIVKADGVELDYSPIPVPTAGDGTYVRVDPSVVFFPENTQHVSILYLIYDDAGFNTLSRKHQPAMEHYVKDNPVVGGDPEVINKLNQLIDIVTSHDVNSQVVGEIWDVFDLVGQVLEETLVGVVNDDFTLVGEVMELEAIDSLGEDDTITGTLGE